jgi:hypothetical protein
MKVDASLGIRTSHHAKRIDDHQDSPYNRREPTIPLFARSDVPR